MNLTGLICMEPFATGGHVMEWHGLAWGDMGWDGRAGHGMQCWEIPIGIDPI